MRPAVSRPQHFADRAHEFVDMFVGLAETLVGLPEALAKKLLQFAPALPANAETLAADSDDDDDVPF